MQGVTMAELVKVALDAMGGDNAPAEIVKGAVEALNENDKLNALPSEAIKSISDLLDKLENM